MDVLTITRLGHQGDGIAPDDGHDIYVPFSLPGETVSGEVVAARMADPSIVTASNARVKPPCPHFKACGGCALQHASDGFLADWKARVVVQALAAQGLHAEITGTITSPARSRRRATLAGRRTKKGALVGFHGRVSGTITPIPDCTLLQPDILRALPHFEEITKLGASRKGEIALAITVSPTGLDVAVSGAKTADGPLLARLGALAGQFGFARLSWNNQVVATCRPPYQRFGRVDIVPPAGGFLQATEAGQAALTQAVRQTIGAARRVVDLFSGSGTFTLPLAETAEVAAFEAEATALAALDRGWRETPGLKPVTTEVRDLFRRPLLPPELAGFEAAVIDPPRAGAKAQIDMLANSSLRHIAYVSCNPVSFARDAAVLVVAGFTLGAVTVVDQFRWSPHVELLGAFAR